MSSDDGSWSGYLPPHELRGLLATLVDRQDGDGVPVEPGPTALVHGSPGLATAALAPPPTAPSLPDADPNSLALVLARMAGEHFAGASIVPLPMSNLGTAPGLMAPPGSPGISPELVPQPAPMTPPGAPVAPATGLDGWAIPGSDVAGVPNTAGEIPTSRTPPLGGSSSAWNVPGELKQPMHPADPSSGAPMSPAAPSGHAAWMSPEPRYPVAPSGHAPSGAPATSSSTQLGPATPTSSQTGQPSGAPTTPMVTQLGPATPTVTQLGPATPTVTQLGPATPSVTQPAAPSVPSGTTTPHAPSLPSAAPPAMPRAPLPAIGSGGKPSVPGAPYTPAPSIPSGDVAGVPAMDLAGASVPLHGGAGSLLSPPAAPFATTELDVPRMPLGHQLSVPLVDREQPAAATTAWLPEPLHVPVVESPLDGGPYWLPSITGGEPAAEPARGTHGNAFDPYRVRKDFPILDERVHGGKRIVWLDNAATTQKPRAVIDRLTYFYEHENSNVHRAAHTLAARATDAFESARETTRKFLNASSANEIIFVRGATEGINLIAKTWGRRNIEAGDEIILTHLEHHANIVPWQQLCAETHARLRVVPVDDRGEVLLEEYEKLFNERTKLVTFTQVSNALGTITPAREMIEMAHRHGVVTLLDGAQAVSHMPVDVQQLDCDFYVFSGHKVFAPTGIGAVFGKRELLDAMPPWQGGGNMIADVTFERTTYQPPPGRFEAGTGNIADAAGMGAALDYVMRLGMPTIDHYEHELLIYGTEQLARVPGLHMVGTSRHKAGVLSFVLDGQRTEDVGAALDKDGIAVRSGHHCAQPILRRFGLEASVRASLAFYNVREDIDELVAALFRLQRG